MEPTVLILAGAGLAATFRTPLLAFARACPLLGYISGGSSAVFVWWLTRHGAAALLVFAMAWVFSTMIARAERRVLERAIDRRRRVRRPAAAD